MKNTKVTPVSAEIKTMKDAARRLSDSLATKGITVTHANALEALTASLGVTNWRTLREKLNGPRPTAVAKVVKEWDEREPRWTVHAVYTDNKQRYGDDFFGDTALEAQINAQMDRFADSGWITHIEVSSVIDRMTGKSADEESCVLESELMPTMEGIEKTCGIAQVQLKLTPAPVSGAQEANEFGLNMRAVEFWAKLSAKATPLTLELSETVDTMVEEYSPDIEDYGSDPTLFTDSLGVTDEIDVSDALHRVVTLASQGLDLKRTENSKATGVFQVLQTRSFLVYFKEHLEVVLNGAEI